MGDASVGDALISAVALTLDGQGGVLHVNSLSRREIDDVVMHARELGVTVLDVAPSANSRPFAFGAFAAALHDLNPALGLELVAADGLSAHAAQWMQRELVLRVAELTSRAPVLVVVRDVAAHDPIAAEALETITACFENEPVLWLVVGGPADEVGTAVTVEPLNGLRSFSDDAALILELMSVADAAPRVGELAVMSGIEQPTVATVVEELHELGVVSELLGAFAFANTGLRVAVRESVPAALQRDTRRSWIELLDTRGVSPVILATGAQDVEQSGDEEVADLLMAAVAALRDDDPDTAAAIGLDAVSILLDHSNMLTDYAWELLPLLWQTSRPTEARALTRRVFAERGEGDVEAQVLFWLSRFEGSADRAVQLTGDALAIPGISDAIIAKLLGVRVRSLSTLGRTAEVDEALPRALQLATAEQDWETLSRLQSTDSIRNFYAGHYATSRALSDVAHASFERSGVDPSEWMPELIWRPFLIMVLGDPKAALERCDTLITDFTPSGKRSAMRFLHSLRGAIMYAIGDLGEASDEALAATLTSQQLWGVAAGATDRLQSMPLIVRLKVALHRGDVGEIDDIRTVLDGLDSGLSSEADNRVAWWQFVLDDAQPRRRSPHTWTTAEVMALEPVSWMDPAEELLIYRALTHGGHDAAIARAVQRARQRLADNPDEPLAHAIAEHIGGLADDDPDALERAAAQWRILSRPLCEALAREDRAVRIMHGARQQAVELLLAAHEMLERAGAERDAGRVRRALRDAGYRLRAEPLEPGRTLTPAETRVVERAAHGMTTTQIAHELFLSSHTVVSHLRSVYRKLGFNSRRELVDWWASDPAASVSARNG